MNGEADNSRFVNMHVYMHLAFKELSTRSCLVMIHQRGQFMFLLIESMCIPIYIPVTQS